MESRSLFVGAKNRTLLHLPQNFGDFTFLERVFAESGREARAAHPTRGVRGSALEAVSDRAEELQRVNRGAKNRVRESESQRREKCEGNRDADEEAAENSG